MKVLIQSSRFFQSYFTLEVAVAKAATLGIIPTHVICDPNRAVGKIIRHWCERNYIDLCYNWPDWEYYGKKAGPIYTSKIVKKVDAVIAIWDGQSKGTEFLISKASKEGLKVFVFAIEPHELLKPK